MRASCIKPGFLLTDVVLFMRCWLCEYNDDPVAKGVTQYINEQCVTMGPELMAERVHETLVENCPMADGIGLDEVRQHITSHMLQPGVRVACMMRSLLKLVTQIRFQLFDK